MGKKASEATAKPARPVKLQMNNSGAWKDVVVFDAGDDDKTTHALAGAASLGQVSKVTFRIVMCGALQEVLMHWSAENGWVKR